MGNKDLFNYYDVKWFMNRLENLNLKNVFLNYLFMMTSLCWKCLFSHHSHVSVSVQLSLLFYVRVVECCDYFLGQQSQTLTLPSESPNDSPTKSAQSSPTSAVKHVRPRAKSVETDPGKRMVNMFYISAFAFTKNGQTVSYQYTAWSCFFLKDKTKLFILI